MDALNAALATSTSGLMTQGQRISVISQNIANADSFASEPGQLPYQRKIPVFKTYLDRDSQSHQVKVDKISVDNSQFKKKYEPNHPAADEQGYVTYSNVNTLIEMMDMRQAQRTYEANLSAIQSVKESMNRTLDLLK